MQYCETHRRALVPGGWSTPANAYLPDRWVPLTPRVWEWANRMAAWFPTKVELKNTPCDKCQGGLSRG